MNDTSLMEFLSSQHADAQTIRETVQAFVGEIADDPTEDEMVSKIRELSNASALEIRSIETRLAQQPAALDSAALMVLSVFWNDPGQRDRIKQIVLSAKKNLPVIESALAASAVMYGMYLVSEMQKRVMEKTGGKSEEVIMSTNEKGKTTVHLTTYAPLHPIVKELAGLVKLF